MENLVIVLIAIVVFMNAYLGFLAIRKNAEQDDKIVSMAQEIAANKSHIAEMTAAYKEAQELIAATKEYTKEATNREVAMQKGIDSILGYDAMSVLKNGGNIE